MKQQFLKISGALLFTLLLSSCVNLKPVSHFSSTASSGLQKLEEINYSFTKHCIENCRLEAVRGFEFKRELECNCDGYKNADRAMLLIYRSIKGYFDGLTRLSGNDVSAYNLNGLKTSLTEGTFGDITISKDQANAYATISKILLNVTTDIYRKNKIKKYIGEANGPVHVLLDKLQFILQKNLAGELSFKKEKWYAYYQEMKMNGGLSGYEKSKAALDYYQVLDEINELQDEIYVFATGLKKISEGHQKLYDNRNRMTAKELREILAAYAGDIGEMMSSFNILQN